MGVVSDEALQSRWVGESHALRRNGLFRLAGPLSLVLPHCQVTLLVYGDINVSAHSLLASAEKENLIDGPLPYAANLPVLVPHVADTLWRHED